jgi:hypothetical protein
MGERHVRGVAALRYEDTTDSRGVVAWVKGIPTVAQINFNPCGKIHGHVGRGKADVSDVTGAIARRDVQATAEGDCKMRVVAANAAAFLVCFERRSGGAGVLIAEDYVIVHEVADRLHPGPTKRSVSEEPPSLVGQTIGLTVTTAKQKQYDFRRQMLNLVL